MSLPSHEMPSRRSVVAAGAALAAGALGAAAETRATGKITYVLVHPAWHGGWCWRKVKPLLEAKGHEVHTPTLTGLGERSHLARPDVGLETHVQDILNVLKYEDLGGIALLGHSSSGAVITGVSDRAPERIAQLIYLDAFVPENGQSLMDIVPSQIAPRHAARVKTEGNGWLLPSLDSAPWDQFVRDAWDVTDPADRRWMVERLGPTPFGHFTEKVQRTNAAADGIRRTYIRCLKWKNAAFDRHAETARKGGVWRYRELASSHEPFITMPDKLAEALLELASS